MTAVTPTRADLDAQRAALEPVHRALLEDATTEADRIIAAADGEAARLTADAEAEAAAQIRRAEQRGATSAQVRADQTLAEARTDTHREILHVKDDIRRRLHRAAGAAALGLGDDARYPDLIDALEELARNQLGRTAQIERDPGGLGGIIAVDGSRRVDYTLPSLAERALESLADEVAPLWR